MKCQAWRLWFPVVASAFLLVVMMASQASAQSTPNAVPPLSESAEKGKELFRSTCVVCHSVTGIQARVYDGYMEERDRSKLGLDDLFKRKTLIVGKPLTEANVKEVIKTGPTANMPAFRYSLSDDEIGEIVDFLKTK